MDIGLAIPLRGVNHVSSRTIHKSNYNSYLFIYNCCYLYVFLLDV